jgi:serine/threonine protein kinase
MWVECQECQDYSILKGAALTQTVVNLLSLLERYSTDAKHEATMLAALHHPNVVQCHGATVEGAVLHIAMEYLSGGAVYK